jgi:signal transduction histidine kinase/class 3 adenylate cyclase/ActR/RegA family two-component response regulator
MNSLPYLNGSAKDTEGNIYLGTSKSVIYFNPDEVLENIMEHPKLVISSLYINNKPVSPSIANGPIDRSISYLPDIHLKYTDKLVSLQYSVPEYTDWAERIRYQYKLEGFDDQWIDAENRTFITYSSIPPGKYELRINASTSHNFYEEDMVSLNIFMAPPPWATWWAYTIYILLVLGAIWGFISWRTREQRKKLREVEKLNTRLRQVDRLKDQFLANTSHELRTPLHGIIGLSESMIDGVTGKLAEKTVEMLKLITFSGKRLSFLVNDILDFSKLKSHELQLQLRPLDIHTATDVVLILSAPLIKSKKIKLINKVPQDISLVEADENRVQQILQNLVNNAVKFTDEGEIVVSANSVDGKIEVTVADSGIGISNDQLDNIFKPFIQADGSTTREYGGTGLGLTVTRQLVELHRGTIKVQSEVNKGSQFTFTLPVSEKTRESVPDLEFSKGMEPSAQLLEIEPEKDLEDTPEIEIKKSEEQGRLTEPIHILAVDDDPVNLQVLQNHLSLAGYEVKLANSGIEALDIINKGEKFDLIILDIMMPKLSGYEVCDKLREIYLPSQLPVVMLTAKNRTTDLVEGLDVGANDYLIKPFSKDELLSRIKTHLQLNKIFKKIGKFVPFDFLHYIGRESLMDVQLGDQAEKEVTVLFADIRDYTSLAEHMSPEENFRFINSFVGKLGPVVTDHKGFVNQYMGDSIMAIFPKEVEYSLDAAIQMQQKISEYNQFRISKQRQPIRIGIGLHTGPLVMGIIGDKKRSDPATIADSVNTASRVEGMTKHYGVRILLSENSMNLIQRKEKYHFRYLGKVMLKGKNEVIKVFECFDGDEPENIEMKINTLKEFETGLDHFYKKDFPEASVIFNQIVKINASDFAADYYFKMAAKYSHKGVEEDWSGVNRVDKK